MTPDLAQVLNTLTHEIRTPLAVSQGYLTLLLEGRLTDAEQARTAMDQTRQALGALATYCADMGKISALSEGGLKGIPVRLSASDFAMIVRGHDEVRDATFSGTVGGGQIESPAASDLAHAVALVVQAALDAARDSAQTVELSGDHGSLVLLAGAADALPAVRPGPGAPTARPVNFAKGGRGLKLIWAAFVLDRHGVETWTAEGARASVGLRIPLVMP
ncbi:MAG: histidine kinase dimerization/phospho-acceptor domain-containing protein [Acidimicrobiia bacterium]